MTRGQVRSGDRYLMKYVIDLISVSKEFISSENVVKALDDVTFQVRGGEMAAISGPSGAGKTTLLNIIGGLEKPSSGEARVLGLDLENSDEDFLALFRCANIGFVFQSYNLISTLTAQENVELMMELAGWRDSERNEKLASKLISLVGLSNRADHLPAQLSGGEQQRVAIARALANDPAIILADEPTGNLDSTTEQDIVQLLRRANEELGKTVIVATHDEKIIELADVVYHLDKGRLRAIDRPHGIRS